MFLPLVIAIVTGTSQPDACAQIEAPEGMACVPGGPATIGSDRHGRPARPEHEVSISTFFIDTHEVTNAQYRECEIEGVCPRRRRLPRSYQPFLKADQPAIPISWKMAQTYCVWAGKRLPTEAEWEKVARGGDRRHFPWGDEAPSCDRAHFKGCKPSVTLPVGTRPVGPYGVYDMAGNGYEWVNDWASGCYGGCRDSCGEACRGQDPQGPCGGLPGCENRRKRLLKGGSWYWPAERTRAFARRAERPFSGLHRFSFRCASDTSTLTRAPFWHQAARAELDLPEPPSPEALEIANRVRNDEAVLEIKTCANQGDAQWSCRDPMSYVQSNEAHRGVFRPYIENLGGAYVGLGADQAYDFIASARSRWAWLFDYDPAVVRVHHMIQVVLSRAESPEEFVAAFGPRARRRTRKWIAESLASQPAERRMTLEVWSRYRGKLHRHYQRSLQAKKSTPRFGWLADSERYAYVRQLHAQGRIIVRKGNLLTRVALPDIAKAAEALGVPIRVYYESNAAEQWPLSPVYRENVIEFPFDEHSVVLRTAFGSRYDINTKWLYLVHGGEHFQRRLRRSSPNRLRQLMSEAQSSKRPFLRLIGLPQLDERKLSTAER